MRIFLGDMAWKRARMSRWTLEGGGGMRVLRVLTWRCIGDGERARHVRERRFL